MPTVGQVAAVVDTQLGSGLLRCLGAAGARCWLPDSTRPACRGGLNDVSLGGSHGAFCCFLSRARVAARRDDVRRGPQAAGSNSWDRVMRSP